MIESVPAKKLIYFLWRTGPYMYFFDGEIEGKNFEVRKYLEKMAFKYSKLRILKVDWEDKKKYICWTLPGECNRIYLYFGGEKIDDIILSDKETIDRFFEKAIKFYNISIDKKVENIGTKPMFYIKNFENPTNNQKRKYIREINTIYKKNYISKRKIEMKDEKNLEYIYLQNYFQIQKIFRNNQMSIKAPKNSKGVVEKLEFGKKWFHDVRISDLPDQIFSNPPHIRYLKKN